VYNEEEVIEAFYTALNTVLRGISDRYRSDILFVVDRGTDNTLQILKKIAARDHRVRVLALSARFGHQMALLAGLDHSDADAVVMLDSDLQHPPELIPELLDAFERGHDIVHTIRQDSRDVGRFTRQASRLFYKLVNRLSPVHIEESAADYRLVSRRVAKVFQTQNRERNQYMRGLFSWVGFSQARVTFKVQPRGGGRSKYSLGRLLGFGMAGITSFSRRPLRAAIFVGFGFASLGLLLALITLIQYFHSSKWPSGWTTLVILIAGFSGIHLIFMGIVGEYIGAIFDEVKARPHYLVDETVNFEQQRGP
jgi:glycosyltransferase involved in cell wall biosynthesis